MLVSGVGVREKECVATINDDSELLPSAPTLPSKSLGPCEDFEDIWERYQLYHSIHHGVFCKDQLGWGPQLGVNVNVSAFYFGLWG